MKLFNTVTIVALALASLSLSGCAGYEKAKSFAYSKGAQVGNDYCVIRDEQLVTDLKGRMNTGLRAEGAKFEFDPKIKCDP